jgi:hypothetical protein
MKKTTFTTVCFSTFFIFSLGTLNAQKNSPLQRTSLKKAQSSFYQKKSTFLQKPQIKGTNKVFDLIQSKNNSNFVLTSEHISSISGVNHQYIRQAYNGIEIIGTESSLHTDKNGQIIKTNNKLIPNINKIVVKNGVNITPQQAITITSQKMSYGTPINLQKTERNKASYVNETAYQKKNSYYSKSNISSDVIPLKKVFYYNGKSDINIAYEFTIKDINSPDWFTFIVDANSGDILHKFNLMLSCNLSGDHSDHNHGHNINHKENHLDTMVLNPQPLKTSSPAMVGGGSYNVYPMPIESPGHGPRSIVTDPADANASPYGWHDVNGIAGAEYTYTRGNNTVAYDDDNGSNNASNQNDYAEGGNGLNFNFPLNTNYTGANQSEDAAVTNTFFWANIIHDVVYQYGFDEAAGNFQENNYGNGGAGGDSVYSEIQDGSGTCNANFGTPPEGNNPRMQMYVCGARDGDYDNGVIVHEYTHGISTRLTGGSGNSGCLQGNEQMGEGWGDFLGLMMTIEPGDQGPDQRGIGTWLVGQGPNGAGIRPQPYSTTNTQTYADIGGLAIPHGVGSVWSAILWKLNWALIDANGYDPDIYNGTGGNNICLALVMEGMKLQGCNPGFIDGRDGILAADTAIYGGANTDIIWQVFANSGLGVNADQGTSGSNTDGTTDTSVPPPALPRVTFATTTSTANESTDCNYTDIVVPLNIGLGASQITTASLSISGGTAESLDFQLLTDNVTFSQGASAPQDVIVRIMNDAIIEGEETIELSFTINNNGGNATTGNTNHTITITDDDFDPLTSGRSSVFEDDFESGINNWTITGNGISNFAITNNGNFPDAGYFNTDQTNLTNYAFVNDDECNCNMSAERIASTGIALTGGVTYIIEFDYAFDNQYATDSARIELSTDNQGTWPIGLDLPKTTTATGDVAAASVPWVSLTLFYTPTANETTNFSFLYGDNGDWGQGFIIDNFKLLTPAPVDVETILTNTNNQSFIISTTNEIYTYDTSTNNIIASINNINAYDFGCTTTSITRSGSSTQGYNGSTGNNLVSDKTFTIMSGDANNISDSQVSLFLTSNELTGLTNTPGLNNNNIFAYREGSNDVVPLTVSSFGNNFKLTGTFTGIDGTYYIGAEGAFKTRLAPKVFLSGPNLSSGLMDDSLRSAGYLPTTSPYSDNLTVNSSVFNTTGTNAIVDWVWIELRDTNAAISASRSALLQRDGDVVDLDGTSSLTINTPSKSFYIVVNHRNHLAAMTRIPIALSATPTSIDFTTNALGTFGSNAQKDMGNGNLGLWSGDADGDGKIAYSGPLSDINALRSQIFNDPNNSIFGGPPLANYGSSGYSNNDINMNGMTYYTGPLNDAVFIRSNIFNNPSNSIFGGPPLANYVFSQQLPQ